MGSREYPITTALSHRESIQNRFIYVKQYTNKDSCEGSSKGSQKVLVNPHFKANKVFINPMFSGAQPNTIHVNPRMKNVDISALSHEKGIKGTSVKNACISNSKIHINPKAKSVQLPTSTPQTIHINPNFKNVPNQDDLNNVVLNNTPIQKVNIERKENVPSNHLNKPVVLTRTKLIRTAVDINTKPKRRNSVKSRYKIVKSHSPPKNNMKQNSPIDKSKNRFKIDHRLRRKSLNTIRKTAKKYVYNNRLLSVSDLVKNSVIKRPLTSPGKNMSVVNISGVVYRKSRTTLRRASITNMSLKKSPNRTTQLLSKYKLVKKPVIRKSAFDRDNNQKVLESYVISKKFKLIRKPCLQKNKIVKASPKKMKKCNIPCPHYKKYGLCKGKDIGKCSRKHDPDQIALCTRFLQGACIKENCLLSHNVSPEKMPTCKYYLEGSCSKENCPYLHVKISPKAEVCRDFLEGFCKRAAECDKRHQYLCPDYEKYGNCLKQRCPYPHGKMVRTYFSNKIKFVKKSSDLRKEIKSNELKLKSLNKIVPKSNETNMEQNEVLVKEKKRYYAERNTEAADIIDEPSTSDETKLGKLDNEIVVGFQSRPKLGSLPAFIPFDQ